MMTTVESIEIVGPTSLQFSYGQFIAYDSDEREPGSVWKGEHLRQGFVRREHTVGFATILRNGTAFVRAFRGTPSDLAGYARVISVPIRIPSGNLRLEGPEEYPVERMVRLEAGSYRICVAQKTIDDESLSIDVFIGELDSEPAMSSILVADDQLEPQTELIESGDVAR